jgi:hypothetical protein
MCARREEELKAALLPFLILLNHVDLEAYEKHIFKHRAQFIITHRTNVRFFIRSIMGTCTRIAWLKRRSAKSCRIGE